MEIDRGNPTSAKAQKHRVGLYLRSKDRQFLRNIAKQSVITNSKQLKPKKSADSYKDNYGNRNWNFVKLINKVLQKWKKYEKSRVLPSIRSRDENSSRIRKLFWSGCSIFRATTPLSRCKLKSKGHGKLSIHFAADQETIETVFRIIVFCKSAQPLQSSRKHV